MGIVRKEKRNTWNESVLPLIAYDYIIMEVELFEGRIIIQPIYTASSAGEAELIQRAIKELDPVAKYYVKWVEKK